MSEAAAVLHRVEYALDSANSTLMEWGAAFFEGEEREKPYRQLEEVGREMDGVLGQLRIRFGPEHPATVAFGDADAAMFDLYGHLMPGTVAAAALLDSFLDGQLVAAEGVARAGAAA